MIKVIPDYSLQFFLFQNSTLMKIIFSTLLRSHHCIFLELFNFYIYPYFLNFSLSTYFASSRPQ